MRNVRDKEKHNRELLYYMGKNLDIPEEVIIQFQITSENIQRLKLKHPSLEVK